jgi:hypothetical protein
MWGGRGEEEGGGGGGKERGAKIKGDARQLCNKVSYSVPFVFTLLQGIQLVKKGEQWDVISSGFNLDRSVFSSLVFFSNSFNPPSCYPLPPFLLFSLLL